MKEKDKDVLERKLNSDKEYQKRFLDDPVGTLGAAGHKLSPESATKLKRQVEELKAKGLPSGASVAANGIMISISKSF